MNKANHSVAQINIAKNLLRTTIFIFPIAVITVLLMAFFLWLLDIATTTRWQHIWLIFLLPVAGILINWLYQFAGKNAVEGNNLIIDEIHQTGGGMPARMTPLILFTTIITHLFGGSAGREGTAVQMGGSLTALFARWYKLHHDKKRILLMCAMNSGFSAVFGTPVAGAIFAMEVINIGKTKYKAVIQCLFASVIAHIVCICWHLSYYLFYY